MKRSPRVPSQLSRLLHQRLNAYALAASAAGVGVLALAKPVDARIVYTKTYQVIGHNKSYNLDLNNDGVVDFVIKNVYARTSGGTSDVLHLAPAAGNAFLVGARTNCFACAAMVVSGYGLGGASSLFAAGKSVALARAAGGLGGNTLWGGNWGNVRNGYLGLKFNISGETHYGWARLNVRERVWPFSVVATITGYAYETIPNKPIIAGKTRGNDEASLGHLAQGTSGVAAWRQNK